MKSSLTKAFAGVVILCSSVTGHALTLTNAHIGDDITGQFNGMVGPDWNAVTGLSAELTLTLTAIQNGGTRWQFSYTLENTSGAPMTGSRVSSFAFATNPDATGGDASGLFENLLTSANLPGPLTTMVEVCLTGSNNCSGAANGGLSQGDPASGGTFYIDFASATQVLDITDIFVRWQSLECLTEECSHQLYGGSGVGRPTSGDLVPLPAAAWLFGSALLGLFGIRRVRRQRVTEAVPAFA